MTNITTFLASKAFKYVLLAVAVAVALFFAVKYWPLVLLAVVLYLAYVERDNLKLAFAWFKAQFESTSES